MKLKFFAGSLKDIETEYNKFEETVNVSDTALTLKPDGNGVLVVKYSKRSPIPSGSFLRIPSSEDIKMAMNGLQAKMPRKRP